MVGMRLGHPLVKTIGLDQRFCSYCVKESTRLFQ